MNERSPDTNMLSVVVPLSLGQAALWGALYYAFAVILEPMCSELRWSTTAATAVFSASLLISGLFAVPIGRVADRYGARSFLILGALLSALALALWSRTSNFVVFSALWGCLGITSAAALQTSNVVFAQHFPTEMKSAVVTSSLVTGLSAAIFVPLCQFLVGREGWRCAVDVLALICIVCAVSFAVVVPRGKGTPESTLTLKESYPKALHNPDSLRKILFGMRFWGVAISLACNGAISTSLAVHIVGILDGKRYSSAQISLVVALVGPAQVAARALLAMKRKNLTTAFWGRVALGLQIVALTALWLCRPGSPATALVYLFAICNGVVGGLTLVVAALITSELFGTANYGAVQGVLKMVSTVARSAGPVLFAFAALAMKVDGAAISLLVGLAVLSFVAFSAVIRG
ncbi:MFS transporter [Paraburkholderia sp. BR14263]|uniref:MFS transporter n=1 Tax=unclassified Paraburkholderia TaxID=2615204 RepID=UPI0034CE41D2